MPLVILCVCGDLLTCIAAHMHKSGKSPPSIAIVATTAGNNGSGSSCSGNGGCDSRGGGCDGSSSSGSGDGSDNKDNLNNQLKALSATAMATDGNDDG